MKSRVLMGIAAAVLAAGSSAFALQEVTAEDYDGAMKAIFGGVRAVGDQMSEQDAEGVGASGSAIVEGFTTAETYWKARNEGPAIELAAKALAAARQLQEAGAAGDFEVARAAVGELRSTCQPCHQQYRERDADNNWQIKAGS